MAINLNSETDASTIHYLKTRGITVKHRRPGGPGTGLESYRMLFIDTSAYNTDTGWEEIKKPERTSIQIYPKENITSV